MRAYTLTGNRPRLQLMEVPAPTPAGGEVIVAIAAASLNYRDLLVAAAGDPVIPLSDGAGTIVAVGEGVSAQRIGERVVIAFMPGWVEGRFSAARQRTSLGGAGVNGVLAERIAVAHGGAVRIPDSMSFEDACCLPCAAVTAWAALFERRPLLAGETLLLLGTGGVSMFALQFAKTCGARVLITSSSDEKLARATQLGADQTVNYRRDCDWAETVLRITSGEGADLAVDIGGPATLNHTLKAVRYDGRISLMGVLTGYSGPIETAMILRKRITLQGIFVGSASMLQTVVDLHIKPVIDKIFEFECAEDAYSTLERAEHVGKLVIRVAGN